MDGGQAPVRGETLTFGQTIRSGAFVGLSLKNALLSIVTLTLYRFWGKTEVRRRVWSNITLNGVPFEYTGKGKELFLGFLLALVTLGVPFLALVLLAQFGGRTGLFVVIPMLYAGMPALIGAAIFLSFRYMASRTTWSGIRFRLRGSPWGFGFRYLGATLLTGITLGWYAPAMAMVIAEDLWGDLRYGDQRVYWRRAKEENLYGRFALIWLTAVIGYLIMVASTLFFVAGRDPSEMSSVAFTLKIYGAGLVYGLLIVIASAAYHAAVLREIARSLRFGGARFKLDVRAWSLLGLTLSNILILVFSLGLLQPVVMARTARFLVSRLSSTGEAPLAEARQAERGPKTGEGLADAFDVSPF